ncbi:hypothetical protein COCCADRAFT_23838 [Bipolaris zeicola 26-R-13]|uniref:Uncharacterized protein n=1 Tax=Cochliobolus carbonum (strain 26-R-13) TaxID=930089 RepID=W6YFH8_COCC2|nr:uncharacterized protein COCCADRAFT_23838 [Bipolaris zeicola 26-R-13]EUC36408.1 hypothetical protein COCCADRAFT_23838 [Bipolaris zeicola 26-R-13]
MYLLLTLLTLSTPTLSLAHLAQLPPCTPSTAPCSPLTTPCPSSSTQCATLRSHGSVGIAVCRAGKCEVQNACECASDGVGGVRCVGSDRGSSSSTGAMVKKSRGKGCEKGQLACLAKNDQGKDGAVFRCNERGLWRLVADCSQWEVCVEEPMPHCVWR